MQQIISPAWTSVSGTSHNLRQKSLLTEAKNFVNDCESATEATDSVCLTPTPMQETWREFLPKSHNLTLLSYSNFPHKYIFLVWTKLININKKSIILTFPEEAKRFRLAGVLLRDITKSVWPPSSWQFMVSNS